MAPVLRRRFRRKRTVASLARMLTALDESARAGRPLASRRARVSLGRAL
jgi:hypothetical protein